MSDNEIRFDGRQVVVTGAASGIGYATATAFAERGIAVLAVDVDPPGLGSLASRWTTTAVADQVTEIMRIDGAMSCA